MKQYLSTSISAVLLALAWPAVAQNPSPQPSTQTAAPNSGGVTTGENAGNVQDGIVFYNGRPYLIRNGRASVIDATLVPEGQILTNNGQFVPIPATYNGMQQGQNGVQPGIGQRPGTVSTNGNVAPASPGANSAAVLRDGRVGGDTPNPAAGTSPGTNAVTNHPAPSPSTTGGSSGQPGSRTQGVDNSNQTGGARSGTTGGTTGGTRTGTSGGTSGGTPGGGASSGGGR